MQRSLSTGACRFQTGTALLLGLFVACAPSAGPERDPAATPAANPANPPEGNVANPPEGNVATPPGGVPNPPEGSVVEGVATPPEGNVADGSDPAAAALPPIDARPAGRLIDAHVHLGGYGVWPEVQSVLDEVGIDYVFNLSGGSPRRGQTLAMMLAEDSGGRVANFMTVDWEGVDELGFGDVLAAELELLVTRYDYVGLKISKALGLYVRDGAGELLPVDDPRLFPLWAKAGELGVPVFIHTGDPRAFWEPVTPENERYAELQAHPRWSFAGPEFPPLETLLAQRDHLLELFPDTVFVGVHFGGYPEDLDYVDRTLTRYPNFYVDIAARVPEIGRHDPARVRDVFIRHQDRILFATDIAITLHRGRTEYTLGSSGEEPDTRDQVGPFFAAHHRYFETADRGIAHPTPIQGDWTVDAIDLPADVLDKVYYLNAYRLVLEGRDTRVDVPGY